jgi:hypothetical protein
MHSDLTLDIMDEVTASLGKAFRHFDANICSAYATKELSRETNARRRRRLNADRSRAAKTTDSESLKKKFNLQTYKYHALGDYSRTIRRLGTTDSYSTSTVHIVENLCTFRAIGLAHRKFDRVNLNIAAPKHGIAERIAEISLSR